jgi:hypothetical protein
MDFYQVRQSCHLVLVLAYRHSCTIHPSYHLLNSKTASQQAAAAAATDCCCYCQRIACGFRRCRQSAQLDGRQAGRRTTSGRRAGRRQLAIRFPKQLQSCAHRKKKAILHIPRKAFTHLKCKQKNCHFSPVINELTRRL